MAPTKDDHKSLVSVNGLGEQFASDPKETDDRVIAAMKKNATPEDTMNYYNKWAEIYDKASIISILFKDLIYNFHKLTLIEAGIIKFTNSFWCIM